MAVYRLSQARSLSSMLFTGVGPGIISPDFGYPAKLQRPTGSEKKKLGLLSVSVAVADMRQTDELQLIRGADLLHVYR